MVGFRFNFNFRPVAFLLFFTIFKSSINSNGKIFQLTLPKRNRTKQNLFKFHFPDRNFAKAKTKVNDDKLQAISGQKLQ
jgi:hypothetical protein